MKMDDYKDIVNKAKYLARQEFKDETVVLNRIHSVADIDLNNIIRERNESELLEYLNSLDAEAVKILLTIMYIGRDYPETREEYMERYEAQEIADDEYLYADYLQNMPKEIIPVPNPLNFVRQYMLDLSISSDKDINVNQIYSKSLRLPEYLERAIRILGI